MITTVMFNKIIEKISKAGFGFLKKTGIFLFIILIVALIFLVFADKINEWAQKYNGIKNQTEKSAPSLSDALSKVKKISNDVNNGIAVINEDLQDLKGLPKEEAIKQISTKARQYIANATNNKTINGLMNICLENGIDSAENCFIKITDEISNKKTLLPAECDNINSNDCLNLIAKFVASNFTPKEKLDIIKEQIKKLTSTHITITKRFNKDAGIIQKDAGQETILPKEINKLIQQTIPVIPEKNKTFLILPSPGDEPYSNSMPAVLMNDDDNDGLPDEMEKRLGTNSQKADTDGDGYSDYIEIKHDYDPNGPNKKDKKLSPVEMAILNKTSFEQPIFSTQSANEALKVEEIKNKKLLLIFNNGLEIKGRAKPNEIIALYIYSSMPIVITIKTDANGNWIYDFDKKLIDGDHKAYVVINNDHGEIEEKSNLFNFFIKGAIAVDSEQYLKERVDVIDRTKLMIFIYISAGLLLVFFLMLISLYQIKSMEKIKEPKVVKEADNPPQIFYNHNLEDLNKILKSKKSKK